MGGVAVTGSEHLGNIAGIELRSGESPTTGPVIALSRNTKQEYPCDITTAGDRLDGIGRASAWKKTRKGWLCPQERKACRIRMLLAWYGR